MAQRTTSADRCAARTIHDGERCRKTAILGTDYCFCHLEWPDEDGGR